MIQTRREFLDDFLDYVGHADDDGARNTAETLLNSVLESLAAKRPWRALLSPTAYEFSTVANVRAYGLPPYFGRVSGLDGKIRNLTTGDQLFPRLREEIEAESPTVGTTLEVAGKPDVYYLAGTQPVFRQPAITGDALEVLSSSALDATVRVEVAGLNAAGDWTRQQVILTGLAPVAIGTWTAVHEFAKAYPDGVDATTELTSSEGTVTLRIVAGAINLQTLFPEESAREVEVLNLFPMPDAVYRIAVPFIRAIQKVFHDADTIPNNWGGAVFEEMHIEWQVQAGELTRTAAASTPRPAFVDLVCLENAAAAQANRFREPYR